MVRGWSDLPIRGLTVWKPTGFARGLPSAGASGIMCGPAVKSYTHSEERPYGHSNQGAQR